MSGLKISIKIFNFIISICLLLCVVGLLFVHIPEKDFESIISCILCITVIIAALSVDDFDNE